MIYLPRICTKTGDGRATSLGDGRRVITVACLVLALWTVAPLGGCRAPARAGPPNVILVVVDTLRADHLCHYGYGRPTAAGMDAFASVATLFTQCYAPEPWTEPSVASIMTGLFPPQHGVVRLGLRIRDEAITLAEALRGGGWATAGFSFNPSVSAAAGFDQGFTHFDEYTGRVPAYPDIRGMLARARAWVRKHQDEPFFLYLQPMNVHGPYKVPRKERRRLLGAPPGTEFRYYGERMSAIMNRGQIQRRSEVTPAEMQSLVDQYDTAVHYTMNELGKFFASLRTLGLFDNSLIIVTSDHGEELFDHGGFSHGFTLHREALHVPLYVKQPHQIQARSIDARVSLLDLYPTVHEVLGLVPLQSSHGRSLASLLNHRTSPTPSATDGEQLHRVEYKDRCVARAIVTGGHKLIEIQSNYEGLRGVLRLYDLRADPNEQNDLASGAPRLVQRLLRRMRQRFAEYESGAPPGRDVRDQLDIERLRGLGYL